MLTCAEAVWLLIQYRTRSRGRAAGAGMIGVAAAFVISACWPWPILAVNPDFPRTDGQSALRLVTSSEATEVKDWRAPFGSRSKWQVLRSRVGVAAIEPGWTANGGALEGALQIDGRTALQSLGPTSPSPLPLDGDGPESTSGVLRRLLGVDWLPETPMPEWPMAHLMVFRQDVLPVGAAGRATYRGRMQVVLTKHVVEAALPLQPGMSHVNGPLRIAIESVDASRGDAIVTIRSSNATSSFTRKPGSTFSVLSSEEPPHAAGDRRHRGNSGRDLRSQPLSSATDVFGVAVGTGPTSGFEARIWRIGFESRDRAVTGTNERLKDAELVVVGCAADGCGALDHGADFAIREATTYGPGSGSERPMSFFPDNHAMVRPSIALNLALLLLTAVSAPVTLADTVHHYVFVGMDRERLAESGFLDHKGVDGVQVKYTWRQLEQGKDHYVFDDVRADLELVKAKGKRLFVQVQDSTFALEYMPVPTVPP